MQNYIGVCQKNFAIEKQYSIDLKDVKWLFIIEGKKFNNLKVYFESSMLENILNSSHGIFEVDVDNLEKYVDDDMHNNKNSTNFYVPPAVLDQI